MMHSKRFLQDWPSDCKRFGVKTVNVNVCFHTLHLLDDDDSKVLGDLSYSAKNAMCFLALRMKLHFLAVKFL